MSSISEGLSRGGVEPTGDTFEAALAAKFESAGGDLMNAGSSDEAATEPEVEASTRDEKGRFIPKEEATAPVTDETPETTDTSTGDPAVDAYLAKYNGDVDAAIKAAAHQSDLVGRQGQELGQTRQELAKLQGTVEALTALQTAAPSLSDDQVEEKAVSLSTQKGYFQAATELANESLQGDTRTYDVLLRNWALEDPIGAQRFDLDFQLWRRDQTTEPVATDPRLAAALDSAEVDAIGSLIGVIAGERGEAWKQIAPFMDAALDAVHPSVVALVTSDNLEDRLAGVRSIADKAQLLSLSGAAKTPAQIAAEAAEARKRAGSAVATGSLRPATPPAGSPQSRDEAIAAIKRSIVESDTTSIADGLTYGKPRA